VGERVFLRQAAKDTVSLTIAEVEARTSAEVVVSVRRVSGRYREADFLCGFLVALLALFGLLFLPQEFPLWVFVPDVALSFALGAFVCSRLSWLRRLLTRERVLAENTRLAARAAFVDGLLSRLPGRNAILVYVALFERRVEVVADLGIRVADLGPGWPAAVAKLEHALRPTPDLEAFVSALRGLGSALAEVHPRTADDVNELPDEVTA
jgi:putative membrane protein